MAVIAHAPEPLPLTEMNTTPLIDVMLVLLIMFIITIPVQTHAVKLDLPVACADCPVPDSVRNEVIISAEGAILWNGQPVSRAGLRYNLERTQRISPIPELHLRPAATAKYALVDEVLAITRRSQVQKMGFVGNERYLAAF